jgi:ferredoxin-NADP reductase
MASPVKIKAIVENVVKHTGSVASYRFAPQGRVPKFHAGQFLHLALDEYHPDGQWPESRVFSIASSPSERARELAVTVSVKGRFTERIFQTLQKGSTCWLKLPYGAFLFPPEGHLTLIAGGVGITPYLSFLKQMLEEHSERAVTLWYGVRSADHYLFRELLSRCEAELKHFRKNDYSEDGSVPGNMGALDINAIHAAAPAGSLFYLSGPPAMIGSFRDRLRNLGVECERLRVDDWE